jgi:hypothetical protein
MRVLQGGTEWHRHKRANRPGNAHAEVVGVPILALTSITRERAALLREGAAAAHAPARHRRLESRHPAEVHTRDRGCASRGAM